MKKDKTRYLGPSNFEQILRLASGLSHDETIATIKAFQAGLGDERLFTASEVKDIVNRALAHQKQREPLMGSVADLQTALQRMRAR